MRKKQNVEENIMTYDDLDVDQLIVLGDEHLDKDTFDGCLSALDLYVKAQQKMQDANDDSVDAKVKYLRLIDRIADANKKMADPRIARN